MLLAFVFQLVFWLVHLSLLTDILQWVLDMKQIFQCTKVSRIDTFIRKAGLFDKANYGPVSLRFYISIFLKIII